MSLSTSSNKILLAKGQLDNNLGLTNLTSKGFTIQSFLAWIMVLAFLEVFADTKGAEAAVAMAWLIAFVVILNYGQSTFKVLETTWA
jgi:hypothetical protein